MALPKVSPPQYRRATFAALILLTVIVVTGAAVRLTNSGLGCTDWPNCNETKLVSVSSYHEAIEQLNRLFTGLVTLAVVVAVLGSVRREPKRRDLVWLSWGLVGGVFGQIIVGGVAVLTDLNPAVVACHFLVSIILVTNAVVLHHRAADPAPVVGASDTMRRLGNVLLGVALVAIMAGTVVTGTGPHGGDENARRFQFVMTDVVRVHSALVWVLVAFSVFVAIRLRREAASPTAQKAAIVLLVAEVAQGAVGYTQYFMGVPPLLVAVHIVGALAVWIAALRLRISMG